MRTLLFVIFSGRATKQNKYLRFVVFCAKMYFSHIFRKSFVVPSENNTTYDTTLEMARQREEQLKQLKLLKQKRDELRSLLQLTQLIAERDRLKKMLEKTLLSGR
jgi:hypothetical protein